MHGRYGMYLTPFGRAWASRASIEAFGVQVRVVLLINNSFSTKPHCSRNLRAIASRMAFPYIYIRCPCTDVSLSIAGGHRPSESGEGDEEQEPTFDPRSRRANFSLYPMEHLLYCEDCQQIRCPKCTIEEIACWYCPSCLFEIPSSSVKSDGGR